MLLLQGRYEIISLSGSFLNSESNGTVTKTGNLSVSLAGQDGRIVGGSVAGMLVAGSQVQVTPILNFYTPLKSLSVQVTEFDPRFYIGNCRKLCTRWKEAETKCRACSEYSGASFSTSQYVELWWWWTGKPSISRTTTTLERVIRGKRK